MLTEKMFYSLSKDVNNKQTVNHEFNAISRMGQYFKIKTCQKKKKYIQQQRV